jgi:hypothetical protein
MVTMIWYAATTIRHVVAVSSGLLSRGKGVKGSSREGKESPYLEYADSRVCAPSEMISASAISGLLDIGITGAGEFTVYMRLRYSCISPDLNTEGKAPFRVQQSALVPIFSVNDTHCWFIAR